MSKRIQGGAIRRVQQFQYINTTHIPAQMTINAVDYYRRKKHELKNPSNGLIINLSDRNADRNDLKNHIQQMIKSSKNIDPFISNYIKQVRVEPVINQNKFSNFNEESYPLNQQERVNVVEEKYFPLQNYYNYIYGVELQKEVFRFVNQTQEKVKEVVQPDKSRKIQTQSESHFEVQNSHFASQLQDKKIKGFYESRFKPLHNKQEQKPSIPVDELVPRHVNYNPNNYRGQLVFMCNQNKRMELSRKR